MSDLENQPTVVLKNKRLLRPFVGSKVPPIPETQATLPEPSVSIFSRYTYSWIYPLLKTGYLRTLQENDLYTPEGTSRSIESMAEVFEKNLAYYREKNAHKLSSDADPATLPRFTLLKAINATFFWQFWGGGFAKVLSDCGMSLNPLLTRHLISFTMDRENSHIGKGIGFALGIAFLMLFSNFCVNIFFFNSTYTGAQIRAVLAHAIFKKNLRLSAKARLSFPNGKITSMMSSDVHRIDFSCQWFHFTWTFPVSIAISLALVLVNIGASGLIGFAILLIVFFFIIYTGRNLALLRKRTNKVTDKRVSLIREILQAMKIIKFYSWEDAYEERIREIRTKESSLVIRMLALRNLTNALSMAVPVIAGLLSFIVLSTTGGHLNPSRVFSSITTFNILRLPLMFFPLSIVTTTDAYQAFMRIEEFLSSSEVEHYVEFIEDSEKHLENSISITNGSFIWETLEDQRKIPNETDSQLLEEKIPHSSSHSISSSLSTSSSSGDHKIFKGLSNINLDIKRGEFVIITGTIGTGKSSLLAAIAGMMHKTTGSVRVSGNLLSAGQPWIQNATVRDNITFGQPFDKDWYNKVITSCSLIRDFDILPAGDQTEVGERGITLSGGQKARINLARAVYNFPDIILLDDVLSAVDAHVGKFIMTNCICGLLSQKTCLLATHQLAMLEFADRVIFLDGSGSAIIGTVEELREQSQGFKDLMEYSDHQSDEEEEEEEEEVKRAHEEEEEKQQEVKKILTKSVGDAGVKAAGGLIQAEDRATSGISKEVYLDFVRHGSGGTGWFIIVVLMSAIVFGNYCQVFTNVWLSFWVSTKFSGRTEGFYIGIYVLFGILTPLLMYAFYFTISFIGSKTSKNLHLLAVHSIFHAPMSFFDSSPLGRILNRFTHDTETMDNELSDQTRLFFMSTSLSIATYILVICYIPWFAIALAGLFVIFLLTSSFYRSSAREIKRLDSLGRSVVFARFSESLSGVSTITAYRQSERFTKTVQNAIDRMNSAYYLTTANQRWLSVRLDLVGCSLTIIVTILCATHQFNINPSSVGLVVSSMLQIVPMISLIVREMATVENAMNAVERLHHYAYNLPQESKYHIPETSPPPEWPTQGQIEFSNVSMSYKPDLPPALKNFNANIRGGEKIGICGRTGAGKSTIMTAIYRLVEIQQGTITIDEIDISRLGLHNLRSKLSIIPQDPILFQGTVRSNIDPFGDYTDDQLWDALRRAWLVNPGELGRIKELESRGIDTSELIKSGTEEESHGLPKFHLDRSVDDEGTNFSLGERQLLALATALVRNTRILILDEATSNVDFATDSKIQDTIVREFGHCTILCIAHRLRTILNYDRILVMDKGEIAEFDSPLELFQYQEGIFHSMCESSGITIEDFEKNLGTS
ncbi:uncharacterized protein SAPINGB_P005360 [Magnusiomyces paraingens]|uniref:Oligomycin resistance ATP-dependent permease YOR1 n=1 Tax=Magnusiomyces paraingens TaxID=2606893 RepID=A0A5E8BZJ5_9ASCO|nr:uncharacterized protein SAPINGB_P005360 [Saprochaete ingens]VVT56873.1 unnamed protein product [Saprochaete ingens]